MEEEDFGFTKRDLKVLRNALVTQTTEKGPDSNDAVRGNSDTRGKVKTTGVEDRDGMQAQLNNDDDVKAGSREGGAAGSLPETGSLSGRNNAKGIKITKGREGGGGGGGGGESSTVVRQPPSIPNVVEYHLKVKTSSGLNRVENTEGISKEEEGGTLGATDKNKKLVSSSSISSGIDSLNKNEKLSSEEFRSKMALDNTKGIEQATVELPQTFQVKYLGSHDARGLWGIKHTRRPVDNMVTAARSLPTGTILPFIKLVVGKEGVGLLPLGKKRHDAEISKKFSIDTISYGVQDLVYTRVFSMIVVREVGQNHGISPFECHGFVCESRQHARQLTYALANAFQIYSLNVKAQGKAEETTGNIKKRFAIDLRTPEEIEAELTIDSEA